MKSWRIAVVAALLASPAFAQKGDYHALVEKGFAAAQAEKHDEAVAAFQDALLVKPEGREAAMDLGLSLAKSGKHEEAIERFDALARRAADDPKLKARAIYNRGRSQIELSNAAVEKQERDAALKNAFAAMASCDEALAADPQFEDAKWNREQARHLLERIAKMQPPPPQEQQQQSKDDKNKKEENEKDEKGQDSSEKDEKDSEKGKNEKQQDQSQGNEGEDQKPPEDQDQKSEEQGDPQDKGEEDQGEEKQQDGEKSQGDESKDQGQQGQSAAGQPGDPKEGMDPREAEKLLQLLDDQEMMPMMMRAQKSVEIDPEKTW